MRQTIRPSRILFDKDVALTKALQIFWRDGYDGSSLADLTKAMGINKPSLYATFGDKETLFLLALELYESQHGVKHVTALESEEDPYRAIRAFLFSLVKMLTSAQLPGGCLVINGATDRGSKRLPPAIQKALSLNIQETVNMLVRRLRKDKSKGRLVSAASPEKLATFVVTVMMGLGVLARAGFNSVQLSEVVETALIAFPTSVS